MKKIRLILIGIIICLSSMYVNGQTEKGKFMFSASTNLDYTNMSFPNDDHVKTLNIGGSISYFVAKNLTIGIQFPYYLYKTTYYKTENLDFVPFARYYFFQDQLKPFAHFGLGFGSRYSKRTLPDYALIDKKISHYLYKLGAGISYFIDDFISIDIYLGYQYLNSESQSDNSINTSTNKKLELELGLSILF